MIDFILTRCRDISDVCRVRELRSTGCDTDHSLVQKRFKPRVCQKTCMPGVKAPKRFNVNKLKEKDVCANLTTSLFEL